MTAASVGVQSQDPIPFVFAEWVHATSLRPRVMACWWIPVGGQLSFSRPLLCCVSLRKVAARALRVRMATLRHGVPLRWPDWRTPAGVAGVLDILFQYRLCGVH